MNDAGVKRLYDEIAAKLETADREFRGTHEGYPVSVVEADAASALPISLEADALHRYASAVSAGEPFQFKLL